MPTPEKEATVGELTGKMQRAKLAVLTDYRGLSVRDLASLRGQLRPAQVEYTVAKNTLLRLAARNSGIGGADDLFVGPMAVAFCYDDIVAPAKTLTDFARTSRILNVVGAVLDGQVISADDVTRLATLPPVEQLRAEAVGVISGPLAGFVGVLNGVLQMLVGTLEARSEQMGGAQVEVEPAGSEQPSVETPAASSGPITAMGEEQPAEVPEAPSEPMASEPPAEQSSVEAPEARSEPMGAVGEEQPGGEQALADTPEAPSEPIAAMGEEQPAAEAPEAPSEPMASAQPGIEEPPGGTAEVRSEPTSEEQPGSGEQTGREQPGGEPPERPTDG